MGAIATINEVELVCNCADTPTVATDADKLDQVVRNLISNAVKLTDSGGRVTVAVTDERDCVVIAVADAGSVSPKQTTSGSSRPSSRWRRPNARARGTGLGLVICRELCAALGCVLSVESAPQRGSVFTVTLPRQYPGHLVIL